MNKLMVALEGKKTYICVIAAVLTVVAHVYGYLSLDQMNVMLGLFGFGGIAGLRDAISKIEDNVLPIEVTPAAAAPVLPATIVQDGRTYVLQP